jgi:quercetin dioxygenase-like cupin family protein
LGAGQLQVGDGPEKEHKVDDVFSEPAGVVVTGRAVTDTTLYVVLVRQPGEAEARPA